MKHIPYEERVKTYTNAMLAYGDKMQLIVALEELSECQKEICKVLRGSGNPDHLAEEIADATICLEQVQIMHGLIDMVRHKIDEKVRRLDERLYAEAFGDKKAESGLL